MLQELCMFVCICAPGLSWPRSIVNLDKAVDILAEHYEMCEGVKAEVAGLASKKALDAETKKE